MITHNTKIIGGSVFLLILVILGIIIIVKLSHKTQNTAGLSCEGGKSLFTCSDNTQQCVDVCNTGQSWDCNKKSCQNTCTGNQQSYTCSDNTQQCAAPCTGTWICSTPGKQGYCKTTDDGCTGGQSLFTCNDGNQQCGSECPTGSSWFCNDHTIPGSCSSDYHGCTGGVTGGTCCSGNTWDCKNQTCVIPGATDRFPIRCLDTSQTQNKDKTKCINICRTDGAYAGNECEEEKIDLPGYPGVTGINDLFRVVTNRDVLGGRKLCFRTTPNPDDVEKICYHSGGHECDSSNEGDVAGSNQARNNMQALAYGPGGPCDTMRSGRDDCGAKNTYVGFYNNNYKDNADTPVYLYLQDLPNREGVADKQPIHCWSTTSTGSNSYLQFAGPTKDYLSHVFPGDTGFCEGALNGFEPLNI